MFLAKVSKIGFSFAVYTNQTIYIRGKTLENCQAILAELHGPSEEDTVLVLEEVWSVTVLHSFVVFCAYIIYA